MQRMINTIYNLAEETLSGEQIDRLISELETLRDSRKQEETEKQIWEEARNNFNK